MQITQRQAQILAAIVRQYSETGKPVGSEDLAQRYHFPVSPATVRNEMQALEKAGLVSHPHTSAGRMPTDEGFRYFVTRLMRHLELSSVKQRQLRQELRKLQRQYLELGRSITKLLAGEGQGAAFALLPEKTSTSGFAQVIEQGSSPREIKEVARFLDEVEEHGRTMLKQDLRGVRTYIAPEFSLLVTKVNLPRGEKGMIGILGPKRMKYARNIGLLEYVSKLLSAGLGVYVIFHSNILTF